MTEIRIAQFKSHLSHYLRSVRRGNEIVILDRETPIARVLPFGPPPKRLVTIPPTRSLKEVDALPRFRPKGLKPGDVDAALRWVRRDRFRNGPL